MKDNQLLWFSRFLFVPTLFSLKYYPLFKHKNKDALFSLHALLEMGES